MKITPHYLLHRRLDQQAGDRVRVDVGSGTPVLQVSLAGELHGQRDPDRSTAVGDARLERVHVARLVLPSQALFVSSAVLRDVLGVRLGELLDRGLDGLHAAVAAHRLGREVGVGARAVPVSLDRLGGERADDAHVLTEAVEEPASDHDLVADLEGADGPDLELPLAGHDLGVDSGDDEPGLDAGVLLFFSSVFL